MMKYIITSILLILGGAVMACPVCEKQQPAITRGITHGAGPESGTDWIIVAVVTGITILTLFYSVKYLIRPGEKESGHIKYSVLK